MASPITSESILTLPVDLLKHITNKLDVRDEKALKLTCKRMNLLIARPPPAAQHDNHFLAIHAADFAPPPRDGRSTPLPQSPMPWKEARTLQEIEQENREVEDRERSRGMELSDTEDGFDDTEDDRSVVEGDKPTKYKGKRAIMNWTTNLDSAPSSPRVMSPSVSSFAHDRPQSPAPQLPSFRVTTS
ncbi:hypothetical protein N0V82_001751 [Gnomoniopsis sp. IMI 355080]|nr:hypothetical protein N0V82_001751 [Gnomoniopsis sp. IMI 355080]